MAASATTHVYWLTTLLILLTISAELAAGVAVSWLAPLAAPDLGAARSEVSTWVSALGGAALPLSTILVAALVRRVDSRTIVLWDVGLQIVGAALAAAAPTLPVLIVGRFCVSFAVFMILLTLLPAFVLHNLGRINASLALLAVGIVGSSAAGTLLGRFFEHLGTWRAYFVVILRGGLQGLQPAQGQPHAGRGRTHRVGAAPRAEAATL